jgi:uncharacterized RDD family membrane protein YckC
MGAARMNIETRLDTRIAVETPEGIDLHLHPAGVVPRALAWLIDLMLRLVLLWMLAAGLALLGRTGLGFYLLALFAVLWLYPVLFELLWHGQTPGKRALGLRVLNADGTPVGWVASSSRNLLRTVDMLPLGYALGTLCSMADPRSRRLGDLAAGTLVVHAASPLPPPRLPEVEPEEPPRPLQRGERDALIAFAERHRELSPERQIELAGLARDLSERSGEAGVRRLFGIARGLLGQGQTPEREAR